MTCEEVAALFADDNIPDDDPRVKGAHSHAEHCTRCQSLDRAIAELLRQAEGAFRREVERREGVSLASVSREERLVLLHRHRVREVGSFACAVSSPDERPAHVQRCARCQEVELAWDVLDECLARQVGDEFWTTVTEHGNRVLKIPPRDARKETMERLLDHWHALTKK